MKKPSTKEAGPTTKVIMCGCPHPYQDKVYGLGRRLHNYAMTGWRCTVCERTKPESK